MDLCNVKLAFQRDVTMNPTCTRSFLDTKTM